MSSMSDNESYQVIWLIRRLFRALAQKSSENLQEYGISAADRAVLEFLYPDKKLSVPEIAEQYQVSRQHIQVTVNSMLDHGLVYTRPNPRHKRSPLVMLNAKGRRLFAAVLENDQQAIDELFSGIASTNIRTTMQTMQSLLNKLS